MACCTECGKWHFKEYEQVSSQLTYRNWKLVCPECGGKMIPYTDGEYIEYVRKKQEKKREQEYKELESKWWFTPLTILAIVCFALVMSAIAGIAASILIAFMRSLGF